MLNPEELEEFLASLNNQVNADLIRKMLKGNENWINGTPEVIDQRKIRSELANAQKPKIVVLTCADSRVSPEYIFDANIGDVFVIRVAGNVVTPEILASIEFSITELNSTLVCILGHESCGAISAKIADTKERFIASTNLLSVLNKINVNIDKSLTDNVVRNIKKQTQLVKKNSYIVAEKYSEGDLDIVGMYYSLETGEIKVLKVDVE